MFLCRSSVDSGCNKERKYRLVSVHPYKYKKLYNVVFCSIFIKLTYTPLQTFSLLLLALDDDVLDTVVMCCDCVTVDSKVVIILKGYRGNIF